MGVGLFVQRWLASRLGTSATADVFQTGVALPTVVATAFMSGLPMVLIPIFIERRKLRQSLLSSAEASGLLAFSLVLTAVLISGAGWLAQIFGSSYRESIATFLRVSAPLYPLVTLASIAQANLYSQNRYGFAGSSGLANGVGLLLGLQVTGGNTPSVTDIALSIVFGYLAQTLWVATGLRGIRVKQQPSNKKILRPTVLLVGSYMVIRLQPIIERYLAVNLGVGSAASLGYATKVLLGFTLLAGFGVAIVTLPAASAYFSSGELSKASHALNHAFQLTVVATLLSCTAAWSLSVPIVQTVLANGAFQFSAIVPTSDLIRSGLLTVAFGALSGPLVAILYAAQARSKVVVSGLICLGVGFFSSFILRRPFGTNGIVFGSGLGNLAAFVFQLIAIRQILHGWSPLAAIWKVRIPFATLFFAAFVGAAAIGSFTSAPTKGQPILSLLIPGLLFTAVVTPFALWTVLKVLSTDQESTETNQVRPS